MKTTSLKIVFQITLITLLFSNISFSQSNNWQRAYRYSGDMYCEGICQSDYGNYFLLMRRNGVMIYKINSFGDSITSIPIQWRTAYTCISSGDGGIVFTGRGANKPYSTHLTAQGLVYWDYNYTSGIGTPEFSCIIRTSNSYITAGESIMKFNLEGGFIWQKNIPTKYTRIYYDIIEDNNGGYLLSGEVCDSIGLPTLGVVTQIDTAGTKLWDKRYSVGDANNGLLHMKILKFNNSYFVGGYCCDPAPNGKYNITIFKLDLNGNVKDTIKFPSSDVYNKFFWDMKLVSNNRIVLLFNRHKYYDSTIAGAMLIDTSGNIIRTQEYTGADYTKLQKIFVLNSNTFFFTGISDHYSIWFDNPFVVKTDTMLYAPPVSVRNLSQTVPDKFYLNQNYPNPFNNSTQITFGIRKKGIYKLSVYDVTGKLVDELFNQNLEPGEYKTDFNAEKLSSGIYFYRLESDKALITKKFVLLK